MPRHQLGVLLAIYAAGSLGTSVAISTRITGYPRLGGLAVRYGFAAAALLAIVLIRRSPWPRVNFKDFALLLLLAATGMVGFNLFILAAVSHADPGAVGAIVGTVPLLLAVIGPLQVGHRPASRALLAAAFVVAGAVLAEGAGSASLMGVLLALGALVGEALFSLLATPVLPRLGPMFVATFACALVSAMALALGLMVDGGGALRSPSVGEGVSLLYLGAIVSGLGFFAWYAAILRLGVAQTGLFSGLVPVFALITGWLLSTNNPNLLQLLGALIVGAGVSVGISRSEVLVPVPAHVKIEV